MTGIRLALAALLLTCLTEVAAAAEIPEHPTKHAHKALVVLAAMGVNDSRVTKFVNDVNTRIDNGYFMLAEERNKAGRLVLHYDLSGGVRLKQLELRFTPADSNFMYTARPDAVMVNYRFKF